MTTESVAALDRAVAELQARGRLAEALDAAGAAEEGLRRLETEGGWDRARARERFKRLFPAPDAPAR